MREAVKAYPDKHGVSVRGLEWSLWIQQVVTKDNRVMCVLKPLEVKYSEANHDFSYEDLKSPIWLSSSDLNKFVEALREIAKTVDGYSRDLNPGL